MSGLEMKKDVILLAAPTMEDTYYEKGYEDIYEDIIEFDIAYANAIHGRDKVYIIVDEKTRGYFLGKVPEEILITSSPLHIWMRDFTTINPYKPIQFRYTPATFDEDQKIADEIQGEFNSLMGDLGITYPKAYFDHWHLLLDGGNIVDNYHGRVITTTRFLEDNELSYQEGVEVLKKTLNAKQVAIIEYDEPIMAHSDGMVMFVDENTLFVNEMDESLRTKVLKELKSAFGDIKIVEIEAKYDEEDQFSSCGINLNATVTSNYIYMPHFGDAHSDKIQGVIQKHTSKEVVPVLANGVCKLGGSVRCLSWQLSGQSAIDIIEVLEEEEKDGNRR